MQTNVFLILFVLSAVVFLLNWLGNYPRRMRYRHNYYPILALTLSIGGMLTYSKYSQEIKPLLLKILERIFDWLTVLKLPEPDKYAEYFFILLMILVFAIFKLLPCLFYRLNSLSKRIFSKKAKAQKKINNKRENSNPKWAYRLDQNSEIVLKNEWEYIYLHFYYFSWGVAFIASISLFMLTYNVKFPIDAPVTSALALLVTLEMIWYLNGFRESVKYGEISGKNTEVELEGEFKKLWEAYQEIWERKVLYAGKFKSIPHSYISKEQLISIFNIEDENYDELVSNVGNLLDEGYRLTHQHCDIAKRLYHYNDIIISNADYNQMAPIIINSFIRAMLRGYNILIIIPYGNNHSSSYTQTYIQWARKWFLKLSGSEGFGEIRFLDRFDNIDAEEKILVATADDLLNERIMDIQWFQNIKTVMFCDITEVFANNLTSASVLLHILRKRNQDLQCVIMGENRRALESSVRRNLDIGVRSSREKRVLRNSAQLAYTIIWLREGRYTFQQEIFTGDINKFLGYETVLGVLPWRMEVEHIQLSGQEKVCWDEYLEELENCKENLDDNIKNKTILKSKACDRIQCSPVSYLTNSEKRQVLISRDRENNFITTLLSGNSYAQEEILHLIVSPPYLLRDYFADKVEYFYKAPLYPLTARMMVSKFSLALSLMHQLILEGMTEDEILKEIHRINIDAKNARNELKELFLLAFKIDIIISNHLTIDIKHIFIKNHFEERHIFKISPEIKESIHLQWLKRIEIIDQRYNNLGEIYFDHLFQNYLPAQIHAFSEKPYRIDDLDIEGKVLRVSHTEPENIDFYRPLIEIELNSLQSPFLEEHIHETTFNGIDRNLELCEADFVVRTSGYYFGQLENPRFKTLKKNLFERDYQLGRVLKVNFFDNCLKKSDASIISSTLVVLIKEALLTLLPETHQYIIVASSVADKKLGEHNMFFPSFTLGKKAGKREKCLPVNLYIFEDSHQDLGLLQSILNEWDYVFKVIDDYISWILETDETEYEDEKSKTDDDGNSVDDQFRIDRSRYLKFNFNKIPEFINLEKTSTFLRRLVGDNDLTQARRTFKQKKNAEIQKSLEENGYTCDFCSRKIASAEIRKSNDGKRIRCKSCSDSAINHVKHSTYKDLEDVYIEGCKYLKESLDLQLRQNINIQFATVEVIKDHFGTKYKSDEGCIYYPMGFVSDANFPYQIHIESGMPYHLTLTAIVKELAYIWMLDNVDSSKIEDINRMNSGISMWIIIHCLETKKMANEYCEEIKKCKGEMGKSYDNLLKIMKKHKKYATPFKMLSSFYPKNNTTKEIEVNNS